MKACRLTSPPDRRTFDRRLANMSIDIKERILTIGNMFVKEEFVDPYIVSEGTTLLKAKGHLGVAITQIGYIIDYPHGLHFAA